MRRIVLALLLGTLALLLAARAGDRPGGEAVPAAAWDSGAYNVLELDISDAGATAGCSRTAALDAYFLSRPPTAKNDRTGQLAGRNLVLLLAEDWSVGAEGGGEALERLRAESARFPRFYAPDWYQGPDGREFALLSAITPTAVGGGTAMAWVGEQGTSLPFALGNALTAAGYTCRIYPVRTDREQAYAALGFETGRRLETDEATIAAALPALADQSPFAACFVLSGTDGEGALAALLRALADTGLDDTTAVCLAAGGDAPLQGTLLIRGEGLAGAEAAAPCSELDVTPTLLNLLGAGYDARFLFGRDLFAAGADVPVSLYGSAYSDWVADAGGYTAGTAVFSRGDGTGSSRTETVRYVRQMRRQVYDRYVCAQLAVESNYFRIAMGQ